MGNKNNFRVLENFNPYLNDNEFSTEEKAK